MGDDWDINHTQNWSMSSRIENCNIVASFDFSEVLCILKLVLYDGVRQELDTPFIAAEIL